MFSTDSAGNITAWDIQVAAGGLGQINIENFISVIGPYVGDQATVGFNNFPPGTAFALNHTAGEFTMTAAVPEHLGDDDPRFLWARLHDLPTQDVSVWRRLILTALDDLEAALCGRSFVSTVRFPFLVSEWDRDFA